MKLLGVVLLVLMLCSMVVAAPKSLGVEITDPNFSVSAVTGLTTPGSGACVSYEVVTWKGAALQIDGGALVQDWTLETIDPFVGLSTNIKPLSNWTENSLSIDTTWGLGYLFRAEKAFAYVALRLQF